MAISLPPLLQKFVDERVKDGRFASEQEVVEAGLARLMLDPEPEFDDEDVAAIEESEAQIARGETLDWTEVAKELRKKFL